MSPELDAIIARLERADAIVQRYTDLITDEAKRLAPVETGALRDSIAAHLDGMASEITAGEGLDYAAAQEYGTATIPAHPYFRVAFERYADAFFGELQALLG